MGCDPTSQTRKEGMNRCDTDPTADALASAVVDLMDARRLGTSSELGSAVLGSFARLVGARRARIEVELDEQGPPLVFERRFDSNGVETTWGSGEGSTASWIVAVVSLPNGDREIGRVECDVEIVDSPSVRCLVALAAHLLVEQRSFERLTGVVGQLDHALKSRLRIERAKGVMSERMGVSPEDAFAQLRASARSEHRSVDEVAADVLLASAQRRV